MYKKALSGTIVGILIGMTVAVLLARHGVWPPDQITLFLLPAITGLAGLLLLTIGREGSYTTTIISLIILLPMLVWGALGVGDVNETGELNGGCTVVASSDLDTTTVTDTSRRDPFQIQESGSMSWTATSPEAFQDYEWQIGVDVGGFTVPLESGTEPNDAGDLENGGDVPDVGAYAASRGVNLGLYSGVYEVGGSAASCDGFGFVHIVGDGLDVVAVIAWGVLALLLVIMGILFFPGRRVERTASDEAIERSESVDVADKLKGYEAGSEELFGDDSTR
ncbi:MAG TPA: hypothetical protein VFT85_04100 [Acidimicrobiia bacterium]|nr:hypothetical protein [Acidimicrobiia bacterium]